jgi:hypothetical protein
VAHIVPTLKIDTMGNKLIASIIIKNHTEKTVNLAWSDLKFLIGSCDEDLCIKLLFIKKDSSLIHFKNPNKYPLYEKLYRIITLKPKDTEEIKIVLSDYYDIKISDFYKVIFTYKNKHKKIDDTHVWVGKLNCSTNW